MKRTKRIIGIVLFFLSLQASGQDLHFSQYFNAPLLVNPANTGFNPDYSFRVGGNYRSQWANLGTPYNTMSIWGDARVMEDRFENGWLGIGGSIIKDVAGSGSLSKTGAYGSIAYHQMVGYNSLLSGGFSLGYVQKRVDISKLNFDNQWNGNFFDISIPSNEPFAYSQVGYLDINMGLNYAYFASDNVYLNAGVSIMHVNRPKESFFSSSAIDNSLQRRYTAFANANIKIENLWIINPNIYVSKMGGSWETVLGMNANRNLSGDGYQQLIVGLYYRNHDALIPMIGYQVNDLKVTLNYDATISTLGNLNGTRGAYEISVIKSGIFTNSTNMIKCPSVKF
jgi:type IX secretion system PorP/SprF family membrane protein